MSRKSIWIIAALMTAFVASALLVRLMLAGHAAPESARFDGFRIDAASVRIPFPGAAAGAAYLVIGNASDDDDRLVDVRSNAARRAELHSHVDADGIVMMQLVDDGFPIPAGGTLELVPGGDHVMFMGLEGRLGDGDRVPVTLVFEVAGEIELEIPVRTGPQR